MKIKGTILHTPIGDFPIPQPLQGKLSIIDGVIHEQIYKDLPPIRWDNFPTSREEIYNHQLEEKQQKFSEVFKELGVNKHTELKANLKNSLQQGHSKAQVIAAKRAIAEFEYNSRRTLDTGLWFFNKGFPTYMTGYHYVELCFWKTTVSTGTLGYKTYRDKDRRIWIFDKFCDNDKDCFGTIYMKGRRDGATSRALLKSYFIAATGYGRHTGMQSQDDDQSSILFKKHIVEPSKRLPSFWKPKDDGNTNPKKAINFTEPSTRMGKEKSLKTRLIDAGDEELKIGGYLDSTIDFEATVENAYDSQMLQFYLLDEAGKLAKIDVTKMWGIVKRCLMVGKNIIGKAAVTSTVEEGNKGGANFKKLWNQSNYSNKSVNNRTVSGLYRLFLPAYDGYEGFIDEYGYSIIENPTEPTRNTDGEPITIGSKQYLLQEREAIKESGDEKELAAHKRMCPFNENDALMSDENQSLFDTDRIYSVIESIVEKEEIVRGNFVRDKKTNIVTFHKDDTGRFHLSYRFDEKVDKMNKHHVINPSVTRQTPTGESYQVALLRPTDTLRFVAGCDPIEFGIHDKDTGRRSNAAMHVMYKYDPLNPEESDCPVLEYNNGLIDFKNINVFYEDALCVCLYYGCEMLVESQKMMGLYTYFDANGCAEYLMNRPQGTITKQTTQKNVGIAASKNTNELLAGYLAEYLYANCEKIRFIRTLTQLLDFNLERTKEFDLAMSLGYMLAASKKPYRPPASQTKGVQIWTTYP